MELKAKLRALEIERMAKIKEINSDIRGRKKVLYDACEHEYGEWFTRTGTVIPDTNILGEYFQRRKCEICGFEEKRLPSKLKPEPIDI